MPRTNNKSSMKWFRIIIIYFISSGIPVSFGAYEDAEEAARRNLIVITLDTLRADHLGCYGYFRETSPELDKFADQSIFFERCIAPMAVTLPSHISLFTGKYPLEHNILANYGQWKGLRFNSSNNVRLLSEIARDTGYDTAAFISASTVNSKTGIAAGFRIFNEPHAKAQRNAGDTNEQLFSWLDGNHAAPLFLWIHYFDPHTPYDPPEPFNDYFKPDSRLEEYMNRRKIPQKTDKRVVKAGKSGFPEDVRKIINYYDGEIRYMDAQLGRLFSKLKTTGFWENSVILIIGDHGEGLFQHDVPLHGSVWDEQLHVPLMIRIPGGKTARIKETVSLVHVIPYLLLILQDKACLPFQEFLNQSHLKNAEPSHVFRFPILGQAIEKQNMPPSYPFYSLIRDDWKIVMTQDGSFGLFNLDSDPFELKNVYEKRKETGEKLKKSLLGIIEKQKRQNKRVKSDAKEDDSGPSPETIEQLRELGYL